ncbi:MAG TPA: hypothetical protein VII76_12310 [Acidimicrobiales bacterium]
MTMESGPHEAQPWSADLVRSDLSSPDLWHEILERLREVQEGQAKLADAIEVLGLMVQDALDAETQAPVGVPSTETAEGPAVAPEALDWRWPPPEVPGSAGWAQEPDSQPDTRSEGQPSEAPPELRPEIEPEPVEDVPVGFKDPAGLADSFITSVEASAPWEWSGAAQVHEPAVEKGVPEPVFYVPSFDEEVLPATSVAELSASALDAAFVSEFGTGPVDSTGTPPRLDAGPVTSPAPAVAIPHADTRQHHEPARERGTTVTEPARLIPTAEHNKVLDILLGTPRSGDAAPSHVDAHAMSSPTALNTTAAAVVTPARQSTIVMAPPPPPPPPPAPVITEDAAPSSPVFDVQPEVLSAPPVTTDPPLPPPPPPPSASPVFRDLVAPEAIAVPVAPPPPPPAPVVEPVAVVEPVEVEVWSPEPPTVIVAAPAPVATVPDPDTPMVHMNGTDQPSTFDDPEDEALFTTDESHHLNSAASMATEILAMAPDVPVAELSARPESELISKDVTLIARGRKKRFRLH